MSLILQSDERGSLQSSFTAEEIQSWVDSWMTKAIFKPHEKIIRKGVEKYIEGDDISAISILYPKIEGLMRYSFNGENEKPTSKELRDALAENAKEKSPSSTLFLPDMFNEYLKEFYFRQFNLKKQDTDLSRHSHSHGVATIDDYSRTASLQAILILDQIHYYA